MNNKYFVKQYLLAFQMMFISYNRKNDINSFLLENNLGHYVYDPSPFMFNYIKTLPKVLFNLPSLSKEDLEFRSIFGLANEIFFHEDVLNYIIVYLKTNIPQYLVFYFIIIINFVELYFTLA